MFRCAGPWTVFGWGLLAGCGTGEGGPHTDVELPGHNECLPEGEVMSEETCLAVVEHDGRQPTSSSNVTGIAPDPDDPRLDDPEYQWLASEIERCTCVCCHTASYGGPGVHRWNFEHAPVWIDSANEWTLSVFVGDTNEYDQTLPTDDPERMRAVIDREPERRGY